MLVQTAQAKRIVNGLWHIYASHSESPFVNSLRKEVLQPAIWPRVLPAEEGSCFEAVEAIRTDVDSDTNVVTFVDFGAGSPNADRAQDTMRRGVKSYGTIGDLSRHASRSPMWGRILFRIIRHFGCQGCVELGTAVGISTAYQAFALKLNGVGRITTIEGSPELAEIARSNFRKLNLSNIDSCIGRFEDVLPDIFTHQQNIDYVYIDGHHDEMATVAYFSSIIQHLADPGILVFDDIRWSRGMTNAWERICQDSRIQIAIDLGAVGICVRDSKATKSYHRLCLS